MAKNRQQMLECLQVRPNMSKLLEKPEIAKKAPLALLFYSLIPRLLGINLPIEDSSFPIGDSFHVGEWFASATTLWNDPASSPLTIHGGWDFIPAIATRWLAGGENYFYPTIYITMSAAPAIAAGMLFLLLARILKSKVTWATITFLSVAAIAAPSVDNFAGVRDLFLIATCWLLYEFVTHKESAGYNWLIVLLITSTSFGVIWSFDRGIAGLITVLTTLLSAAYLEKKAIYLKISSLVVIGAISAIAIAQSSGTIDYLDNLSFLIQTSGQWRYPLSLATIRDSLLAIVFVASTIAATIRADTSGNRICYYPYWLGITACSLIMLRIVLNRPDMYHLPMAMWSPLILTAYSFSRRNESSNKPSPALIAAVFLTVSYYSMYCAYWALPFPVLAISFSSSLLWLQHFSTATRVRVFLTSLSLWLLFISLTSPTRSLVSAAKGVLKGRIVTPAEYLYSGISYSRVANKGNAWAAQKIRDSQSKCLLDMTNSGVINAGVDLPACTQISYPVYATKKVEDRLLRQITNMDASAIVYSTEEKQYSLDGKDMKTRLPKVDALLRSKYPVEQCNERYCIRSLKAMD